MWFICKLFLLVLHTLDINKYYILDAKGVVMSERDFWGINTYVGYCLSWSNISQEPETEPTQDMQNVMLSCWKTFLTTEAELTLWHKD